MGIPAEQQLFYKENFFDFERRKKADIESDIERMSDDDLLRPAQEEMLDYLVETYELGEIFLDKDNIYKSYKQDKGNICDYFGERIYTDILIVYWNIPFEGSDGLLFVQPSQYLMTDFRAAFDNGCLIISDYATIADIQREPDFIENKLKKQLNGFLTQITNLNADIRRYNSSLRTFIIDIMEKRRKKSDIVKKALEKMDIPLKRNPNAPSIIPMRKKLVRKSMPTAEREKSYGISDVDYNHILGVIRHVGATFERARKTFCKLDEEELRDVILADLNGHYMGLATGETFRNEGKTDINIEFENRAAFVGECKVWQGEKIFRETIDQLLGYTTWRDNKNAIIFFNKNNKGFRTVQEKIREFISGFANCTIIKTQAGEWEFKLSTTDYEKTIHVFLFDIYENIESKEL